MSRIFSAGGGKKVSWLDKVGEEKEELIGTAALDLKTLRKLAGVGEDGEEDVKSEDAEEGGEGEKPAFLTEDKDDDAEKGEEGEAHEEGESEEKEEGEEEEKAEAGPAVEQAAAAVEKAKEALEEVSVALEDAGGGAAGGEVAEVPVSLEGGMGAPGDDSMVEVEIGADVGPDMGSDLAGGPDAGCEKCPQCGAPMGGAAVGGDMGGMDSGANATEAAGTLIAGSSSRFHKIAMLSPANKKKLKDYWVGQLGYDPEFVGMMLKDYNPKVAGKKE